jgi:signal transduction histidine kinase
MLKLRLRTKFLLSLLILSATVTGATLWLVGRTLRLQVQTQIADDLENSVTVFQDFQRQREIGLAGSAELVANLPNLKALMTTHDAATIQDASTDVWRLVPSDVFILADPAGKVMAIHTSLPGMTRSVAADLMKKSLQADQPSYWWYGGGHLYQVFLRPIYFGRPQDGSILGFLGVGHEISEALAGEVSRVASSQVAFFYGDIPIAGTSGTAQSADLGRIAANTSGAEASHPSQVKIGDETFLATTVFLSPSIPPFVRLTVLKSYDKGAFFLDRLDRSLIALGLIAIMAGSLGVFLVSYTFTKPLANLVAGVRALAGGDFTYPLAQGDGDEVAELTTSFDRMRKQMQRTQQQLLAAEQLATIGRTARSISHDLRHPLTAVLANAEFLRDHNLNAGQREELYAEIRTAVDQMTDLVESLLEFSHARESLRRVFGPVEDSVDRARRTVQAHPQFHRVDISVHREGRCETWFDHKKVERALVNLLLNACEFAPRESGQIQIDLHEENNRVEIRIADNGPGIPDPIRDKLFRPFVSYGKQNGIGLGLAIGQKIFQDHGGDACLESTKPGRTVFKLSLPILISEDGVPS